MQTNMLLHACGNGNAAEKPKANPSATRHLPNGHAPTERSLARAHTCKPVRTRKINLTRASIHKTAHNPIIVKDNAVIAADAVRLEGCRASEHAATKKAPRLISEEPLIAFMKKTASRRVRSHRCRQSPNRAYRPCRSNRNGWHSSTPGLHRPNTDQPGRRR